MSVLKDIRLYCLECCGGLSSEVKQCPAETCQLWKYRFGKDSTRTRSMTDEQKQAAAERLKSARLAKKSSLNNEENSEQED